ncbi:LysR family transcriptional activator of nhaA [Litoreibacter ponti]|uniref:LysR family transcriptional activator of nhaA n=1 Tax=Litoreibacter ponti TaxID=1510457 RepID=A0A2T6BNL6_9RHOB|nr:LysR family transcriptional regulator [Litoreibacter ponti]PTX57673.1 LysR family transcriptional activator of nhaA [Litoreibacter ponti]
MLNYHHLRYFRAVAHEGNLTRAAERLNVSQSALSTQIKQLEERLAHPLFERVGRRLELTEEGRIALDHADRIFETGDELLATLQRSGQAVPPLRVGALSTLSRNFQMQFLAPLVGQDGVDITLRSGDADQLLAALRDLALDVVLSTEPPAGQDVIAHRVAEQPVGLHGKPELLCHKTLGALMRNAPFILPTETNIRAGFMALADRLKLTPRIVADVDDMAMVRLLARAGAGIAVAPSVVVADELEAGRLVTAPFDLDLSERFFAVTLRRRYPHPLLAGLLDAAKGPA